MYSRFYKKLRHVSYASSSIFLLFLFQEKTPATLEHSGDKKKKKKNDREIIKSVHNLPTEIAEKQSEKRMEKLRRRETRQIYSNGEFS